MAPEENEAVIDYLLRHNGNAIIERFDVELQNRAAPVLKWNEKSYSPKLKDAIRLVPSPEVEAFFVVKLKKELE